MELYKWGCVHSFLLICVITGLVHKRYIDFLVQYVSVDSRVRQGDSKALALGLWDHCSLAGYISCRVSPDDHKRNQGDLQKDLQPW